MMPKEFLEHPLLKQQRKDYTYMMKSLDYSDEYKETARLSVELSTVLQAHLPGQLSQKSRLSLAYTPAEDAVRFL
jgi:hypothetical protein